MYYITGVYNEGYMKLVDSALFALILDDHTPSCPNEMTRTFLHGDAANRYNCFAFFHFINHIK